MSDSECELKSGSFSDDMGHLRLLSIFHYIVGGLTGLFSFFPIIHLVIGLMLIFSPEKMSGNGEAPPAFFGWFFVIFASLFMLAGWALAVCMIIAGRNLVRRRRRIFCLVVAGIECAFMPFGTVLGVFTVIVLMRESVKELFASVDTEERTEDEELKNI